MPVPSRRHISVRSSPACTARVVTPIASSAVRIGTAILAALFVAGTVSARPVAGELAARSRASIAISVSVRPRFDVRRLGADSGAIVVGSNFNSRFSIRDDSRAPSDQTGTPPSGPLLIIVPD
jgi:hypothetical protein